MKDVDSDSRCLIEESLPELTAPETKTSPVVGSRQDDPAYIDLGSEKSVELDWLYGKCISRMKGVDCPFAALCGKELAHDIYLSEAQSDLSEVLNIKAWLSQIVKRRAINKIRDCRCHSKVQLVEAGNAGETDEDEDALTPTLPLNNYPESLRNPEQIRNSSLLVEAVLLQLNAEERQLFMLLYWKQMPVKEIASNLGLEDSTVRKRAQRLREKLREKLTSPSSRR